MKSKIKTILIVVGIILFYVAGIIFLRKIPLEIRRELFYSSGMIFLILFTSCIAIGSFLYRDSNHNPRNKKEKLGDLLCNIAFILRFVFVLLIPFFFAAIIV